jgi:hypothetical protein
MATRAALIEATIQLLDHVAEIRWPRDTGDAISAVFHTVNTRSDAARLVVPLMLTDNPDYTRENNAFAAELARREQAALIAAIDADPGMSQKYKSLVTLVIVALFDNTGDDGVWIRQEYFHSLPILFPRIAVRGNVAKLHTTIDLRHILSNRALIAYMQKEHDAGVDRIIRVPPSAFVEGDLFAFIASKGITEFSVGVEGTVFDVRDPHTERRLVDGFWSLPLPIYSPFTYPDGSHPVQEYVQRWTEELDENVRFALEPQIAYLRGVTSMRGEPWPPPRTLKLPRRSTPVTPR